MRSAASGNYPKTCRRRTACRSPSASTGRTRSTAGPKTSSIPPVAGLARDASRGTACRRRSCWKSCKSWKAKSTCGKIPASPNRRSPQPRRNSTPSKPRLCRSGKTSSATASTRSCRASRTCPNGEVDVCQGDCVVARRVRSDERSDRDPGPSGNRVVRPSRRRRKRSNCCCNRSVSVRGRRRRRFEPRRRRRRLRRPIPRFSLIGKGVNEKEVRQAPKAAQATGDTGSTLPEEFRTGLDAYFNGLEKGSR